MDWLARYDSAVVTRRDFAADRRGRPRHRPRLPSMGGRPADADEHRHRRARRDRRHGGRGQRDRSRADRHPVHRPHERRELDPCLGHGWRRAATTASGSCLAASCNHVGGCYGTGTRIPRSPTPKRCLADGVAARAQPGIPAVWAWDLGNENSNCTIPPDRDRGGAMARADDVGAPSPRPRRPDHDRHPHGGPRGGSPHRPGRGRPLVRLRLHARLPDLRRLVDRTDRRLTSCRSSPPSPAGSPAARRSCSRSSASRRPRRRCGAAPDARRRVGRRRLHGAALDNLWTVGCIGALVWCFTDYAAALFTPAPFDEAVHERTFGLWRADGSPKPAVAEIEARVGAARPGRTRSAVARRRRRRVRDRPSDAPGAALPPLPGRGAGRAGADGVAAAG